MRYSDLHTDRIKARAAEVENELVPPERYAWIDGSYRYHLRRQWDRDLDTERVLFVMLNPSMADELQDDPTIRRCIGFARSWGYGGLEVCNLYAYRATNPLELEQFAIRPELARGVWTDRAISDSAERCALVIAAWGSTYQRRRRKTGFTAWERAWEVTRMLTKHCGVHYIGDPAKPAPAHPPHPLYLPGHYQPVLWAPKRTT